MIARLPARGLALARKVRRDHLFFIANFGLAKATVYLAPLALAAVASERLYGGVELALAIGLQLWAFLLGAPLNGINHAYLVQKMRDVADLLFFVAFAAALALLAVAAGLWLAGLSGVALLIPVAMSAVVVQSVSSVWTRMRGQRNWTAWTDGASLVITGAVVLATVALSGPDDMGVAILIFALVAALLALVSGQAFLRSRSPHMLRRLGHVSMVGMPMMVATAFAMWLGVGGRLFVGALSHADLAAYSLAFRVGGLALGVQQLVQTFAFPRLYAARTREGDRLFGYSFAATLAVSAGIALAGPFVVDLFDFAALDARGREIYRALLPLCVIQIFFWIGFAMLQMRINRVRAAKASILPTLFVTVAGIVLILLAARFISADVRFIGWLVAAHSAAYFGLAWGLLARRGLPHPRIGLVGLGGGLLLAAIAALSPH
ncbi:MAG TPA: hypothetical protein VMG08_17455 [Allosphingosinicella sp.]|nr:hypothetical protein [Allosphingosinicella sp.]